jgi:Mg2+/Co2+ transporter CorB
VKKSYRKRATRLIIESVLNYAAFLLAVIVLLKLYGDAVTPLEIGVAIASPVFLAIYIVYSVSKTLKRMKLSM